MVSSSEIMHILDYLISQPIILWPGCSYEGKVYSNQAVLVPVTRPCDHCQCRDGSVTCVTRQCPPIDDCQQPITLEGACCPICLSCGSKYNGESWKENDCTSCHCTVRKLFQVLVVINLRRLFFCQCVLS